MVILKVYIGDGMALKPEGNSPVACYSDAVFAFPVTPKRVKSPARHGRHLREVVGKLQGGEDRLDLPDRVGRHAAEVVIFVKVSQAIVAERSDNHGGVYGTTVHLSRCAARSQFLDVLLRFAFSEEGHGHLLGHRIGEGAGLRGGRNDVVDGRKGPLGVADREPGPPQHLEGLRAGRLVERVQANEELRLP